MTNIWLEEQDVKGSDNWKAFWARLNYNEALREVRKDNRKERKRGHLIRYRITNVTLAETVKVVI